MITSWEDPNNELLLVEMCLERFGPVPYRERRARQRLLAARGGPDTPAAIARRRQVAAEALRGTP